MKRRKRFTIRLIALGFAVVGLSAAPAQAKIDEGLGYHWAGVAQATVKAPDNRVDRVTPGPSHYTYKVESPALTADDVAGRVTPAPGQPTVVSSSDGFEWGTTIGISGIVLVLGAFGMYLIVHESQKGKFASA